MKPIMTIGYGNRPLFEFINVLKSFNVDFLIDVRSVPYSRFKPEYNRDFLQQACEHKSIKYLFLGQELGGIPLPKDNHKEKVGYMALSEQPDFQAALARVVSGARKNFQLCLVCAEVKPEQCHRSKLLGENLVKKQVEVLHIDENGNLQNHAVIMDRLNGKQQALFDIPYTSRKKY